MNPRRIITKDEFKAGIAIVLFALFIMILVQNNTILSNQNDIDRRLTRIEQNECVVDSSLIDLYQRSNECLWDQMIIRRDIKRLEERK